MIRQTQDLTGLALCYAVAIAVGQDPGCVPRYDLSWQETGPLIEKYRIELIYWKYSDSCANHWQASDAIPRYGDDGEYVPSDTEAQGPNPLVAICRHLAKRHFGRSVNVPNQFDHL